MFYLFINPNDEGYGNLTSREFGLAIKQDENGLYQFETSLVPDGPAGTVTSQTVGALYQKSLDLADLASNYRDKNGRDKNDPSFIPPQPIFDKDPTWELGGYNPETWTGHAPVYENLPIVTSNIFYSKIHEPLPEGKEIGD